MITYYIFDRSEGNVFWMVCFLRFIFIKTHNFIEIKLIFAFTIDNEYNMLYNYLYMQ